MPLGLHRIDGWYEDLAGWVVRRPWPVIIGIGLLTLLMVYPLPSLRMDSSSQALLHPDDPVLVNYRAFVELFGTDEFIIVGVEAPNIFSIDFLKKLKSLHTDLADRTPHLADIASLINVIDVRDEEGRFVVEKLIDKIPDSHDRLTRLRKEVLNAELYLNRLISKDGRLTLILLTTQTDREFGEGDDPLAGFEEEPAAGAGQEGGYGPGINTRQEAFGRSLAAIREIIEPYRSTGLKIILGGPGIVSQTVNRVGLADMSMFIGLALLVICLLLLIMFRRPSGLILPPLIVGLATGSAMGLMVHSGVVITPPTIMLPSFLLAVGIADSVHLLTIFYDRLTGTGDKGSAIVQALGHSGRAILMTSLTTAAGLASFTTAEVASVAHIGIFGTAGVLLALIYTTLLLPALLAVLPIKTESRPRARAGSYRTDRLSDRIAALSCGRPRLILALGALAVLATLTGVGRVSFSHHPIKWLPPDLEERIAAEEIDRRMEGFMTLDVLIDTGATNGILDPDLLRRIDRLTTDLKAETNGLLEVGQTSFLGDLIKEINRALNEDRPEHYLIPDNKNLIAQEVLLFSNSGSSELDNWTDPDYRTARVVIQTPWANASTFTAFIEMVETRFQKALGPGFKITATGQMSLFGQTISAAIGSTVKSYLVAVLVITVMMVLVMGGFKLGLISMIPNLTPILAVMGLMGWLEIPFDLFTLVIGSIAIGLVVDDTIHFMHSFQRNIRTVGDAHQAVRETYRAVGRALIVTTVVLCSASFIFMLSQIKAMVNFGFLIGLTILLALVVDIIITPAILVILYPDQKGKKLSAEEG